MFLSSRILKIVTYRMSGITSNAGLLAELHTLKRKIDADLEEGRRNSSRLASIIEYVSGLIPNQTSKDENGERVGVQSRKRAMLDIEPKPLPQLQAKKRKEPTAEHHHDDEGYVIVHTDGACSANGRSGARAGIGVWWSDNVCYNLSRAVVGGRHTNNTAEIQAATMAIGQARGLQIKKLNIHTDSQFLINCITVWIKNWKVNNWMTKDRKPVKNREDLEALDSQLSKGDVLVKWTHVRGHSGVLGNERADQLAVLGAKKAEGAE